MRPHAPPESRRVRFTRPHAPARKPTRKPHAQTRQTRHAPTRDAPRVTPTRPSAPHQRHVSAPRQRHVSTRTTSARVPRQRHDGPAGSLPAYLHHPRRFQLSSLVLRHAAFPSSSENFGNISPAMLNHPIFPRPMMMMILCISSIKLTLKTGTVSTPRLSPGSPNTSVSSIHSLFTPFETAKEVWDYLAERILQLMEPMSTSWDLSFITFVSTPVRLLLIFTTKCQIYGIIWPSSNLLGPVPLMLLLFMPTETDLVSATFSWLFLRIMSIYGLLFFIAIPSLQLVKLLPNSDLRRLARRLWFISILSLFWPHLSGHHYSHHLSLFGVLARNICLLDLRSNTAASVDETLTLMKIVALAPSPNERGTTNRQPAAVTNSSGPSPDSPSSTLTTADVETIVTQVLHPLQVYHLASWPFPMFPRQRLRHPFLVPLFVLPPE
ncbi:hypothetical protein Acr_04g0003470 [Actinidia rufa]|uniref:Uncharacterized protein n=1 Tax=Actinidia rufa TaxID=165716 RepID=A0A7J0EI87_9ERIC|nr:hypothetical protein Acr_04g0003470 [Actinidia rufa]